MKSLGGAMGSHIVKVEFVGEIQAMRERAGFDGGYRWTCTCGAHGNLHADSKTAWTFGSEHLRCMAPYVSAPDTGLT